MATSMHSRRLHRVLHLVAGALVAGLGVVPSWFLELAGCWLALRDPLVGTGCILLLLGWVTYRPAIARASAGLALAAGFLVVGATALECLGRWFQWDFRGTEAAARRLPPYYRQPSVLTGDVFFRRPGPEVWTGRVIRRVLEELGVPADLLPDEPVITVIYDAEGFRNAPGLTDWDLAVAGDSFTELGFLRQEQLFTTRLSDLLGLRVKNLGVSHTGPLTQLHFLEAYGLAPSTRKVAIMFFEGNDLQDLGSEYHRWRWFEKTGRRPAGPFKPQSSLLRALCDTLLRPDPRFRPTLTPVVDAFLDLAGEAVPVDFSNLPVTAGDLQPEVTEALDFFLDQYVALARNHDLEAWLFYLPAKLRVWHGLLEFTDETSESVRNWEPTDLPDHLGDLARTRGLRFFDLTPALIEATRSRQILLFNPRVDTHLNAAGAAVVADAMTRAFTETP